MMTREYDIFISYSSKDHNHAKWLHDLLEKEGWKSFMAGEDLSRELGRAQWSKKIDDTLDRSGVVIVLVSPDSMQSKWVEYEWRSTHTQILSGGQGMIIPCCMRVTGPEQLGRALSRYQAVDLRDAGVRQKEIEKLLELIEGYLKVPLCKREQKNIVKVLSLEGGGTRALIATRALLRLEDKIRKHAGPDHGIPDCFDMVVGTSAGGVLGLMLSGGSTSVQHIVDNFRAFLPRMFLVNLPVVNFFYKYRLGQAETILGEIFGNAMISELHTNCLIPSYDVITHAPYLISPQRVERNQIPDMPVAIAALSSITVPLIFKPASRKIGNHKVALLDGCLFAKNPARLGYEEARDSIAPRPLPTEICLLSLGNGDFPNPKDNPDKWGFPVWIQEMIAASMSGGADLVHDYFQKLYNTLGVPKQYLRIDPGRFEKESYVRYDDFSTTALQQLEAIGEKLADDFDDQLEDFVQIITQ